MDMVRRTGPSTTPVKRGRGRNLKDRHDNARGSDVSIESPYFSPLKERPKGKNFVITVKRQLKSTLLTRPNRD